MRAGALKCVVHAARLLIAASAIGCAAHLQSSGGFELHGDRGGSFVLLLRSATELAEAGHAHSAQNVAELRALWRHHKLPLAPPRVDFARDVVWSISVAARPEATAELDALTVDPRGLVEPSIRFFAQRAHDVADSAIVFVIAIRRAALPIHPRLRLAAHFGVPELETELAGARPEQAAAPIQPAPRMAPTVASLAASLGPADATWLGSAPLPAPREVAAAELDDGAQVWIVRHVDGAVSVLAGHEVLDVLGARAFSGVRGLQLPVRFRADVRRFYGIGEYDEHGASTDGALHAPLPRYVHAVEGERVRIGRRDEDGRPPGIARASGALELGVEPQSLPAAFTTARLALAEAAAAPIGARVLLDAALQVRGGTARLCPSSIPAAECSAATSARMLDIEPVSDAQGTWVVHGPLFARVAAGGFVELQVPASASYEWLAGDRGARDERAVQTRELCPAARGTGR